MTVFQITPFPVHLSIEYRGLWLLRSLSLSVYSPLNYRLNTLPTSNLSNGIFHSDAEALHIRDFPHPCTPSNNIPFGCGSPNSLAFREGMTTFCQPAFQVIHAADIGKALADRKEFQYPAFTDDLLLLDTISSCSIFLCFTSDLAKTLSISSSVRPILLLMIPSRSSDDGFIFSLGFIFSITLSRRRDMSSLSGSGQSITVICFSSSKGSFSIGDTMINVLLCGLSVSASSLSYGIIHKRVKVHECEYCWFPESADIIQCG